MAVTCPLCSYPTDGRYHKRFCKTTVYRASPATVANFEGWEVLLGESRPSPPVELAWRNQGEGRRVARTVPTPPHPRLLP